MADPIYVVSRVQALRSLNKAYFDLCVPRYWRVTSDVGVRVEIPVARSAS